MFQENATVSAWSSFVCNVLSAWAIADSINITAMENRWKMRLGSGFSEIERGSRTWSTDYIGGKQGNITTQTYLRCSFMQSDHFVFERLKHRFIYWSQCNVLVFSVTDFDNICRRSGRNVRVPSPGKKHAIRYPCKNKIKHKNITKRKTKVKAKSERPQRNLRFRRHLRCRRRRITNGSTNALLEQLARRNIQLAERLFEGHRRWRGKR